jgi:RND superfamily putative drug exporter
MVGLSGLLLIGVQVLVSFGLGGAVVVGVAVLAALTLMPALLAVLGHRIDALPTPLLGRRRRRSAPAAAGGGFWHALALGVMRRPVLVILAVTVWLLVLGRPIASMSLALFGATDLPPAAEAQHGQDLLRAQYPRLMLDPVEVVARTPDGSPMLAPGNLARLAGLTRWLAARPNVTGVVGLLRPPAQPGQPPPDDGQLAALYAGGAYARSPALAQLVAATTSGDTTLITLATDTRLDGDQGKALIDALRAGDAAAGGGLVVSVGGIQAASLDLTRFIYGNFPRTVLLILAVTYVLLLLMFRSLLLPLKAVLTNLLSLGASYGVLVYVFQQGHLQRLLGFTSDGFLSATSPVLIFCILFGLSMDYEVFLLSRVREEWLRGGDNRDAVARGLEKTGGIITSAALLFAIVTGAFTFTTLLSTKELGLGMTVAVVVDAAVIRTLLVPATMRLLGRWNWWLPGQPLPLGTVRAGAESGGVRAAPASGGAPAVGPAAPGPRVAPLPGLAAYLTAESLWAAAARDATRPADAAGAGTPGRVAIVTQVYWLPRQTIEAPDPAAKHPARRAAAPLRRAPIRRAPVRR